METDLRRPKRTTDWKRYKRPAAVALAMAAGIALLGLLAWGFTALFSKNFQGAASGWQRAKNFIGFTVLGKPPQFYHLDIEKNGRVYRVTPREHFEITYKDEFIIVGVASDDLRGKGITVDVDGTGRRNDFQVLMKGIEFVDRVLKQGRPAREETSVGDYRIHVRYLDREIGFVPLKVTVLPQDWLRYAQGAQSEKQQLESLKKAIAVNPGDVGIRKVLAGLYYHQGMYRAAARVSDYSCHCEERQQSRSQAQLTGCRDCFAGDYSQ